MKKMKKAEPVKVLPFIYYLIRELESIVTP